VNLLTDRDGLEILYRIRNQSDIPLTILFAPEFNFALLAGYYPEAYYYKNDRELDREALNSMGISQGVKRFSLYNENDKLAAHFQFDDPTEVWRYPVETVSLSEGGFERVYQSSCVLPVWKLKVEKGKEWEVKFRLELTPTA
jgi:alpha-amylase